MLFYAIPASTHTPLNCPVRALNFTCCSRGLNSCLKSENPQLCIYSYPDSKLSLPIAPEEKMPENILVPGRKAISAVSSFSPGLFRNTLLKTTHRARERTAHCAFSDLACALWRLVQANRWYIVSIYRRF